MKSIKVLQVNKLYPYTGGIEKVVQQLAEGLGNQVDMEVLACRERGFTQKLKINGIPVIRAGSIGILFSLPISLPFLWLLRKESKGKDVLHFHMPFPLGDIGYLLSGYKGKVVVWWHSDVVRQKLLMKLYRPVMEKFLSRADVIIVATQGHIDGSDYLKKYENKCVIIPYGIDKLIEKKADEYFQNVCEANSEIVKMLFVGRLVYYKGCEVLLKAFQGIHNAELTIVGTGLLDEKLKKMTNDYGISNRVHFLGLVDNEQLNKEFEKCDVFILPSVSKSEAFGIVQIEAMEYGKPVINTRLPSGVPYVSLDGVTGLTVKPGDVEALSMAMQWMVDHPQERRKMGIEARERAKKCYKLEDMLNKVKEVYGV